MAKKFDVKKIGLKAAGLGAGAVAAGLVNKVLPNMNPKIRAAAKIAAGVLLPTFMPKQDLIGAAGDGMVAVGVLELAKSFVPAIAGVDDAIVGAEYVTDEGYEPQYVNGIDDAVSYTDEDSM